jgi:hypothetical protein
MISMQPRMIDPFSDLAELHAVDHLFAVSWVFARRSADTSFCETLRQFRHSNATESPRSETRRSVYWSRSSEPKTRRGTAHHRRSRPRA